MPVELNMKRLTVPEKRYYATGKRKTAVARVWIKGEGRFIINGRALRTISLSKS
jgi:ribosomal protein S9